MAKINIELQKGSNKLEVGDIVVSSLLGTRMIVKEGEAYCGVDLGTGHVGARKDTLIELEKLYCSETGNFRVIKSDDIEVSEVGERK